MRITRTAFAVLMSLPLWGCGDSITQAAPPPADVPGPDFAVYPAYVADIHITGTSTTEHVTSPNGSQSGFVTYASTTADTVAREATFYPGTREVGDTTMTISLVAWTWKDSDGDSVLSTYNDVGLFPGETDLKVKYYVKFVEPVHIGSITGGPSYIETQDTYTWSVSPTGGDVNTAFSTVWRKSTDGGSNWTQVCTGSSCALTFNQSSYDDFILRAVTTNSGRSDSTSVAIQVADPLYGPLAAYVDGPTYISQAGVYSWTSSASGGDGSYTYLWEVNYDDAPGWGSVGTGSSTSFTVMGTDGDFSLRLTVTSGDNQQATVYRNITNSVGCWPQLICE